MRTGIVLRLLLIAVVVLAGCSNNTIQAEKPPLRIGWQVWPGWYPALLAEKLGYFEARGLKVQLIPYDVFSSANADYAAGKLDAVFQTVYDVIPVNDRLARDRSVVTLITDNTVEADAIVATPQIRTATDLRGKTVAVKFGSYAEVLVRAMLEKNGLSANDVQLVDLDAEKIGDQLGKTVDAAHTYEPYISQVVEQGNHVIFTGAETPGLLLDVLTVREPVLKERPADIRAFIDAFFEAQGWWRNHQLEGARLIAEATGQDPKDISTAGIKLYDRAENLRAFTDTAAADSLYNSLDNNLKFLLTSGILNNQPKDLNQLIVSDFLK